ncbi:hypothetical protein CLAFUW4_04905 [Fulvia fulva]|uniref:NAD-dependent epimerase/dehydratase domain-containing protein n=1 Tax=Passalora fulva TaxID=5499 RepID=A0A9Q8PI04_PASFU|nr:uncharacterized protein CLAFUR5_12000 [Fulvia fulva]KAK4626548.1 hypothetical protein CLAFUR4_04891 [Fulvia fulva]KAK4628153.1 hypothetical protein CLAFUR0_04895 [Fulvia fulva]UJO23009.1 hypothetical protein CLAFUR5_12000 [Fulvia fulva]WPV14029.1 hypothetical protein CLAFUW4_04905 [Fulvia fulva]WPV28775.1 hypothetical protein CLAFUW7_04899 [Fulvia fulva]
MEGIDTVLVTRATGFIGAHIVDGLLKKGVTVRGTTRSLAKAEQMKAARPEHALKLHFVQMRDFSGDVNFSEAVAGVDAIVHTASPLTYDTTDNEKELILPAINGVKAILSAAANTGKVKRVVLTSSFASVIDIGRNAGPGFTYTAQHWNPLTYEEAIAPETNAVVAYRGSKKFAELEAWNFVEREKPSFDLVAFCPPMTFGPIAHPVLEPSQLNESNARLWDVAVGQPLPEARVPVWIDVRDLAAMHVEAVFSDKAGGKRYVPASPGKYLYELAASVLRSHFPAAIGQVVEIDEASPPVGYYLDGKAVTEDLGIQYRDFETTVVDLFGSLEALEIYPWKAS